MQKTFILKNTIKLTKEQAEELFSLREDYFFNKEYVRNSDRTLHFNLDIWDDCIKLLYEQREFFLKHKISGDIIFDVEGQLKSFVLDKGQLFKAELDLTLKQSKIPE